MPLPPPPPSPLRSRGYSPVLSDESGGCGAGPFPVATSVHPATIIRTNAAASRLRRFIYYDPFDQAGVVILDVPDAGVDGPARHSPGRVGREQGLEAVRVGRLLPQPRRLRLKGKDHRHRCEASRTVVRRHRDDREAASSCPPANGKSPTALPAPLVLQVQAQ